MTRFQFGPRLLAGARGLEGQELRVQARQLLHRPLSCVCSAVVARTRIRGRALLT
jgi:hypothetical protein